MNGVDLAAASVVPGCAQRGNSFFAQRHISGIRLGWARSDELHDGVPETFRDVAAEERLLAIRRGKRNGGFMRLSESVLRFALIFDEDSEQEMLKPDEIRAQPARFVPCPEYCPTRGCEKESNMAICSFRHGVYQMERSLHASSVTGPGCPFLE